MPATQRPVPSHSDGVVFVPPLHFCAAQTVLGPYLRHAPEPSQKPSLPQVVLPSSLQTSLGSEPPAATAAQVPTEPGRLQEKQLLSQADPQHTPCAQKPLEHWSAVEHRLPPGSLPHEFPWQTLGLLHWSLA